MKYRGFKAKRQSRAWDSAISEQWSTPAREIPQFLSDGPFPRVGFCIFWGLDYSCAWDPAIPERWTVPAREILLFLSDGPLLRVGSCDS